MHNLDNKKPLISEALAGTKIRGLQSADADQHRDRITRFGILKHRAKQQENFLWSLAKFKENYNADKPSEESTQALKAALKLQGCGNFLLFKNYYTIDQVKLTKFQVCNQHLLCPFCAGIRASRSIDRYTKRVNQLLKENRKLKPILITLTVKNGPDLKERYEHLDKAFKKLLQRRRDWKKKKRGYNEFCKIKGAFYSYEQTFNAETKEYHPHIHIFALVEDWIDQEALSETWHEITLDSYVVDVRRVRKQKDFGYLKAVSEVFKYALKFGDMTVEKTWEAFKTLKGKRLTGSFDILHGVVIPETMADDTPEDETLPYYEMLYKFVFAKKSYYDLSMTRHVEPHSKDNDDEEELRQRGEGGRSDLAITDEARTLQVRGHAVTERPQRGRKKAHWRIPPATRVRVRQRIRRWDGYIDLIPSCRTRFDQWAEALNCLEYALSR